MDKEFLPLREFIKLRLAEMQEELKAIRGILNQMQNRPIGSHEFEMLKLQVASLSEAIQDLEGRVKFLERHAGMASWIVRQAAVVVLIIFLVWLMGVFR